MNTLVLDASVAIDWFCPSKEGDAYSLPLEKLSSIGQVKFSVPLHFDVEVTRILRKLHKNQPQTFSRAWFQSSLEVLDLTEIDSIAQGVSFALLGELSIAYNLDVPDVPYFHLARTMELPIATRDRGIISACKVWKVLHWQPTVTTK